MVRAAVLLQDDRQRKRRRAPYVMTIDVTTTGADEAVALSLPSLFTALGVDWGDGQTGTLYAMAGTHTYAVADTYTVTLTGPVTVFAREKFVEAGWAVAEG